MGSNRRSDVTSVVNAWTPAARTSLWRIHSHGVPRGTELRRNRECGLHIIESWSAV
jgi:hypothetical protein